MIRAVNLKRLLSSLAIPLAAGLLAGVLTRGAPMLYKELNNPPLSPPGWIFPIVWTMLYVLMGASLYIIRGSGGSAKEKNKAYKAFAAQLLFNIGWSVLFFVFRAYLASAIWLVILIVLIIRNIAAFAKINIKGAYLLIPYLIWCVFALYLNIGVYLLN